MSLPPDYHMHTPLCRHAAGSPTDYAAQATQLGLREIGFSDHAPMPVDDFDNWRMNRSDLKPYIDSVQTAADTVPDLKIRLALEVDFLPGTEDWIRELAKLYPWDYLIGSVHYVSEHWAIDDPAQIAQWDRHATQDIWTLYVERLTQAASLGLFHILAHIDLPKKFGHRLDPQADLDQLYGPLFQVIRDQDSCIEINTAGWRKECREAYPSLNILRLAARHQVPITFGSDAHTPEEVGLYLAEAVALAREAGYRSYRRFLKGESVPTAL